MNVAQGARTEGKEPMTNLHQAALKRAYRTFVQVLSTGTIVSALVAAFAAWLNGEPTRAAIVTAAIALANAIGASITSFWYGVKTGLPEAEPVESTLDALIGLAANQGVSLSSATTDEDAVAQLIAYKPKPVRKPRTTV